MDHLLRVDHELRLDDLRMDHLLRVDHQLRLDHELRLHDLRDHLRQEREASARPAHGQRVALALLAGGRVHDQHRHRRGRGGAALQAVVDRAGIAALQDRLVVRAQIRGRHRRVRVLDEAAQLGGIRGEPDEELAQLVGAFASRSLASGLRCLVGHR